MFEAGCSYFVFVFETEMFLICSYFPDWTLQCDKEEYQKHTISCLSFFFSFKQRWAVAGSCSTKNRFCNCAKTNQKNSCEGVQFSRKLQASNQQLYLSWTTSQVFFVDFEHRCSCILCRLAILKNTYSNIFAERLQWLLLNITSILLLGSIQSFKGL